MVWTNARRNWCDKFNRLEKKINKYRHPIPESVDCNWYILIIIHGYVIGYNEKKKIVMDESLASIVSVKFQCLVFINFTNSGSQRYV